MKKLIVVLLICGALGAQARGPKGPAASKAAKAKEAAPSVKPVSGADQLIFRNAQTAIQLQAGSWRGYKQARPNGGGC